MNTSLSWIKDSKEIGYEERILNHEYIIKLD